MKVNLLTRERLSLLCWALIITYIILAVYHLGDFGPNTGGIKNSDYVLLWSASNLDWGKDPGAVYSIPKLRRLQTAFGDDPHQIIPWLYPPSFLLFILPLGLLPYLVSLAGWPLEPLILAVFLFLVVRRVTPRRAPEVRVARSDS